MYLILAILPSDIIQIFFQFILGTSGRARTVTPVKEPDFESGVSTNSTTLA